MYKNLALDVFRYIKFEYKNSHIFSRKIQCFQEVKGSYAINVMKKMYFIMTKYYHSACIIKYMYNGPLKILRNLT